MCQLLGLSFNKDIHPGNYFSAFISKSRWNPDGWGLACYPEESRSAVVFKEPIPGYKSRLSHFLCGYHELKSKIFIGHIRLASRGGLSNDNTHPFTRCYNGQEFSFAHNGTLYGGDQLTQLTFQPLGETDSERGFCYLLSQLRHYDIKPVTAGKFNGYTDMDFQIIYKILTNINTRTYGIFNCIFSDGTYLFCYRDFQEARYLFHKKAHYNISKNGTSKNSATQFSHIENPDNSKGFIVATEPLDNGCWKSFSAGNMIVFKDGEIVANLS
jgi:predicted glutamine amidotransferase